MDLNMGIINRLKKFFEKAESGELSDRFSVILAMYDSDTMQEVLKDHNRQMDGILDFTMEIIISVLTDKYGWNEDQIKDFSDGIGEALKKRADKQKGEHVSEAN